MSQRDRFDGGGLLDLLGVEDDSEAASLPAQPQWLAPAPPEPQPGRPGERPPRRTSFREAGTIASPASSPNESSAPLDLSNLSSDELVRAIVLADVLGPPPGRRGGPRR